MFSFIEKIIENLKIRFNLFNRNRSPFYQQKQSNSIGDNVGRDKIVNYYHNHNSEQVLNSKSKIRNGEEKLNSFRRMIKHFKKIGIIHCIEAGVDFNIAIPAFASINPKSDYEVWCNTIIITTRPVELTKISFIKNGSTYSTDLKNFKLYIDGFLVETIDESNEDNCVAFDLIYEPKILKTGARVIKLVADVNSSASGKYFSFSLTPDGVDFIDSEMHTKIEPTHIGKEFKEIISGKQTVN